MTTQLTMLRMKLSYNVFVPKRSMKKGKSSKDKLDTTQEVMKLIQQAVRNDPTKEMISFLGDEMEKSHEHELKLFHAW